MEIYDAISSGKGKLLSTLSGATATMVGLHPVNSFAATLVLLLATRNLLQPFKLVLVYSVNVFAHGIVICRYSAIVINLSNVRDTTVQVVAQCHRTSWCGFQGCKEVHILACCGLS